MTTLWAQKTNMMGVYATPMVVQGMEMKLVWSVSYSYKPYLPAEIRNIILLPVVDVNFSVKIISRSQNIAS